MSVEDRDAQDTVPDYGMPAAGSGFAPGAVIGDVWEVEETLGKGGMGSVYRCHNRHATRILAAIKLLDPAFQYHPEAKARFLREAEILYTVDHPNVVKVSNVHLDAQPPYLEMEFVDGMALEDELGRRGAMAPAVAVDRARQLASALKYLHRKEIFHRDVKPQNILIRRDGALKLVDFGLAVERGGDRITVQNDSNFGTVSYCPPEWGRPGEVDPAAWDLYALGVVLYEMLTGTVAFPVAPDDDAKRQMIQVMSDKQRIEALDPGPRFHPGLREVVRKLTHKELEQRIRDAKTLEEALEALDADFSEHIPVPEPVASGGGLRKALGMAGFFSSVLAVGLAAGGIIAGILLLAIGTASSTRDAEILVTGVPVDLPVFVRIGEQGPSGVEGAKQRFEALPVGEVVAQWAVGERCELPCTDCPKWCVMGETPLVVEDGDGAQVIGLEVRPPPLRTLRVRARGVAKGFVRVDGREVPFVDEIATVDGVRPGPHALFAAAGDCPTGCEGAGCGPACSVTTEAVVVPAEGRLPPLNLSLRAPEAEPAPEAGPAPKPAGPSTPDQVTRRQFADWLASHPEWHPDAARTDGRADDAYLSGWEGLEPAAPSSAPVTNVTWRAAAEFCASRGGLAPLGAAPAKWTTGAPIEWRRGDRGGRAWRQRDGTSSAVVGTTDANSTTSFRCAR
ncbi:MAG: serine/threonine protein kinase [Alphaproteobacteria bacterium]|nr:serine/threonine protein kinase [Alphaproteobacteria bacterium]